jgi:hypothetical protein
MVGEPMAKSIGKRLWRMFAGGFLGFAAYCALVVLTRLPALVFRGHFDGEGAVKEWLLPLGAFDLFSKETWRSIPLWVNLYSLFGAILILAGICIGALRRSSRERRVEHA